ncbi:MAG: ABC transporter ATP-binding protein [Bosea sp.]|uniref:ABC transporter ATP-binding protein n=1 Tax=Bosea sp. (in: a-proteobacteria) TaxID=1871050 RepID=UPI001ACCEA03|nr:ABC transporter ATP-binding protein [Bosea sp. (in: a-proteobacteria)]MBN9453725.1 ABC transporter ATP-binding protein [Bosea sp. (in: a-proteobacteria)]
MTHGPIAARSSEAPLLDVRGLTVAFRGEGGEGIAINDVSFSLRRGRILGLVGESGSGKSVTGLSIMGLIENPGRIAAGQILFDGTDLARLSDEEMREWRGKRIAMIFQDPMMTLNPVLRISTQLIETVLAHDKVSQEEARARARDALGQVGIPRPDERLDSYPHEFSGGMRQRVSIAIALLHRPDLIIADEPTTALDVTIQAQILSEVQRLTERHGTALIWVTHDLSIVCGLADEIAVMYGGRIVEHGPVGEVIRNPRHRYTNGLLHSVPSRNGRGQRLFQIPGTAPSIFAMPQGCAFRPRCEAADDACRALPSRRADGDRWHSCAHPVQEGCVR